MTIEDLLKSKVIENPIKRFKKELEEIANSNLVSKLLSTTKLKKEVAEFGLELLKLQDNYYSTYISLGSKEADKFENLIKDDLWEDKNYYELLVFFFGEQEAVYVKEAWSRLPQKMYQSGYTRRSFRAPNHKKYLVVNQVNFLRSLLNGPNIYSYQDGGSVYYDLNIEDQIRFDTEVSNSSNQFMVWSAALDLNRENLFQLFEDIIFNKDPRGKVSRNIIKALLNSEKKESWELVEKLLLAAQRQEGLRQTVLEALDETSIGALQYMIKVIIDHKLTRFSSVVRAIDTWTGLGWESEKETTVRNIINLAYGYFANPETIPVGIQSKNNNEVYMALWVQGVLDVEKTVPYLQELLEKSSVEKKSLALKFAGETNDPYIEMPLYFKAADDENLQVLAFAVPRMNALLEANVKSKFYIENAAYPNFFDKVYHLAQTVTVKEKTFEGKVFSWLNIKFERDTLYAAAINLVGDNNERLEAVLSHFEGFSINLREKLTRQILGDYYSYSFYSFKSNSGKEKKAPTDFQRNFALRILKDRGESLVASAISTLYNLSLSEDELTIFQELFKRKNSNLKKNLTAILLKQEDQKITSFIEQTVEKGDLEQRMSVLDLMLQLQKNNKLTDKVNDWVAAYSARPKITEKESKFIEQLEPSKKKNVLSAENGYGFYTPNEVSPYALPEVQEDSLYAKAVKNAPYGFSKPMSEIETEISKLYKLYEANRDYEYEIENYDNSRTTVLLGNTFRHLKNLKDEKDAAIAAANYPLYEVWSGWFEDSGLTERDLFLVTLVSSCDRKIWRDFLEKHVFYYKELLPHQNKRGYDWDNAILQILNALQEKYVFKEKAAFLIDACSALYANLPESVLEFEHKPSKDEYYYNADSGNGWQNQGFFDIYLNKIVLDDLTEEQNKKVWNLHRWRQLNGLPRNIVYNKPPIHLYGIAFEQNLITESELYEGILEPERISVLTSESKHYRHYGSEELIKRFPFLVDMIAKIREAFLDVEVKRGDSNTSVTHLVQSFQKIFGINRLVEIITALGKSSLFKGYIYSWSYTELTKQKLFSYLLKRCYPLDSDTQEVFNEAVKKAKISEERLIQTAVYAPQWQKFISNYLNWKGLDEGIWWFHAHTKTAGYSAVNSELESEMAKFSSIDLQDFKDGAVDKDWFVSAYKQLGKAKWELLYEAAKYVTDGNGHRRARLYADTITGDLKIREVTAKVKDKRDQDYLRVYGLVPLSKTSPEKDILSRYEYLQQFKKESREFGSMKQASEALAIRVALENLARNAGYPDPVRLTWAMETKQIQNILSKETEVVLDDITVNLVINKEGKADLVTYKGDKELKSIPPKYKKDKGILELTNYRKTMREQWTRSRKGLEESMIRGDEFLFAEMQNLFEHPIISKHLEKLVFISNDDKIGFYVDGNLVTALGEMIALNEKQTFRIAHCFDLHQHNVWTDFQKYCFDNKVQQPFKQIFRELYIPTPDELKEKSISRRYAGHQVQPNQTLALLKTRGWKVDYEEGLQKVFHKEGYQVKMYAMADWFSPADVESPTLETIEFHSLKDYKNIAFEEVNPRIFSEVMRDIDLVVSVAHVGGVDPEASHSSIEMRAVLLRETLRLFKVKNVEIKENHAVITGKMASYSVHLGSAVVHQLPGKYLSVLPIHSQHRGRLFLPFADDDPKSAEVMSKVLLFAKDDEIQDPTILSQIDKTYA
ncbi:DUF4132 domain-containing protein [Flavobacterium reichenbachii]|uniref:DUF4132 domain-containing protein n=1 Tax=Flavobacterium reichenbachii TaxID=362418 RepID=A0A085ZLV9_9FLAO|nr:DUF4132 domain-containing protein [Flavobacterium reichenbachii]KFF05423.1 hypothetical protein IW19_07760 [Flavobacterium reichenbachii]OXB12351.1 hypothetical protein B0A68_19150 [Flavobacterium reichenbachii]